MNKPSKRDIKDAIHSCDDRITFLKKRRESEWDKRNFRRQITLEYIKKESLKKWLQELENEE